MKKTVCILLAVLLLTALCGTAFAASDNAPANPGDTMPDFTVSLTDGTTATLSELLKEKELVVLNVFATWCGPCEREFPDMEKTYQAYSDRIEILSVSGDSDDTMEMVADYKAGHGLTFPMGLAGDALDSLNVSSYPTTIFITQDGKVSFVKVGAFLTEGDFESKINTLLSEYSGTPLPSEIAKSYFPQLLASASGLGLLVVIGRWRLFRKAGKPGWHSLIPILSTCQEFALGWKGWVGVLAIFLPVGSGLITTLGSHANWAVLCSGALLLAAFVIRLMESVKLAKAFGKGTGLGILLTFFYAIGRFGLGLSRAQYQK